MKTLIFILTACIGLLQPLKAQTDTVATAPDKAYQMFDADILPPSFPGGEAELMAFLGRTIQYPEAARKDNIEGIVLATFIVNKDGRASDIEIIKDIGSGCGAEVLRVLQGMPAWQPGTLDGYPVKVKYTLPVRFRLEGKKKKSRALFGN